MLPRAPCWVLRISHQHHGGGIHKCVFRFWWIVFVILATTRAKLQKAAAASPQLSQTCFVSRSVRTKIHPCSEAQRTASTSPRLSIAVRKTSNGRWGLKAAALGNEEADEAKAVAEQSSEFESEEEQAKSMKRSRRNRPQNHRSRERKNSFTYNVGIRKRAPRRRPENVFFMARNEEIVDCETPKALLELVSLNLKRSDNLGGNPMYDGLNLVTALDQLAKFGAASHGEPPDEAFQFLLHRYTSPFAILVCAVAERLVLGETQVPVDLSSFATHGEAAESLLSSVEEMNDSQPAISAFRQRDYVYMAWALAKMKMVPPLVSPQGEKGAETALSSNGRDQEMKLLEMSLQLRHALSSSSALVDSSVDDPNTDLRKLLPPLLGQLYDVILMNALTSVRYCSARDLANLACCSAKVGRPSAALFDSSIERMLVLNKKGYDIPPSAYSRLLQALATVSLPQPPREQATLIQQISQAVQDKKGWWTDDVLTWTAWSLSKVWRMNESENNKKERKAIKIIMGEACRMLTRRIQHLPPHEVAGVLRSLTSVGFGATSGEANDVHQELMKECIIQVSRVQLSQYLRRWPTNNLVALSNAIISAGATESEEVRALLDAVNELLVRTDFPEKKTEYSRRDVFSQPGEQKPSVVAIDDISRCLSAEEVLCLFIDKMGGSENAGRCLSGGGLYQEVQLATSVHRLGKVAPGNWQLREDPRMALLLCHVCEGMLGVTPTTPTPDMETEDGDADATRKRAEKLVIVSEKDNTRRGGFNTNALVSTIWALARLKFVPSRSEQETLQSRDEKEMKTDLMLSCLQIRKALLTQGEEENEKLNWQPILSRAMRQLFDVSVIFINEMLHSFNGFELSTLLWAYSSVGGLTDPDLLDSMAEKLLARSRRENISDFDHGNIFLAYASSKVRSRGLFLSIRSLATALEDKYFASRWTDTTCSHVASSLSVLLERRDLLRRLDPRTPLVVAATAQGDSATMDEIENSLVRIILRALCRATESCVDDFYPSRLANFVLSLATIGFGTRTSRMKTKSLYLGASLEEKEYDRAATTRFVKAAVRNFVLHPARLSFHAMGDMQTALDHFGIDKEDNAKLLETLRIVRACEMLTGVTPDASQNEENFQLSKTDQPQKQQILSPQALTVIISAMAGLKGVPSKMELPPMVDLAATAGPGNGTRNAGEWARRERLQLIQLKTKVLRESLKSRQKSDTEQDYLSPTNRSQLLGRFFDVAAMSVLQVMPRFKAEQVVLVLSAYARADRADAVLFDSAVTRLRDIRNREGNELSPKDYSKGIWALATAKMRSGGQVLLTADLANALEDKEFRAQWGQREWKATVYGLVELILRRDLLRPIATASAEDVPVVVTTTSDTPDEHNTENKAVRAILRHVCDFLENNVDKVDPKITTKILWYLANVGFGAGDINQNETHLYKSGSVGEKELDEKVLAHCVSVVGGTLLSRLDEMEDRDVAFLTKVLDALGHDNDENGAWRREAGRHRHSGSSKGMGKIWNSKNAKRDYFVSPKAMNKQIMICNDGNDILNLFMSRVGAKGLAGNGAYNSVNLATSIHRLAKLRANDRESSVLYDSRFALLVCSECERLIGLANSPSFAISSMSSVEETAMELVSACRRDLSIEPRQTANVVWSLASMNVVPPPHGEKGDSSKQGITHRKSVEELRLELVVWCLRIRKHISDRDKQARRLRPLLVIAIGLYFDVLATEVTKVIANPSSLFLSTVLWAYATTGRADASMFSEAVRDLTALMANKKEPRIFSSVIWSLGSGKARSKDQVLFVQELAKALDDDEFVSEWNEQHWTNAAWGLAKLLWWRDFLRDTSDATTEDWRVAVARKEGDSPRNDAAESEAALKIFRRLCQVLERHVGNFDSNQLSTVLWALSAVGFGAAESEGEGEGKRLYAGVSAQEKERDREAMAHCMLVAARSGLDQSDEVNDRVARALSRGFAKLGQNDEKSRALQALSKSFKILGDKGGNSRSLRRQA